jgi:hypothetical protein
MSYQRLRVEPLAFRVAEEPDGHGGLLRGTAVPGFSQTKGFERARRDRAGNAKQGSSASRKPFSESLSRKCTGTMSFEKEDRRTYMRIGYARVSTDKQLLDLQPG